MNIKTQIRDGFTIVETTGRLNAMSCDEFQRTVSAYISEGSRKLILDFTSLDYISSAGLRTLLNLIKEMRTCAGSLCVVFNDGMVKEVITMSGFDSFVKAYETVEEAMAG